MFYHLLICIIYLYYYYYLLWEKFCKKVNLTTSSHCLFPHSEELESDENVLRCSKRFSINTLKKCKGQYLDFSKHICNEILV